ncbi:MAG: hypothetical protein M3406_11550, partial [Chloroflexota bacterium]|nr:hypothetical protein [Chloroflexota bacterium]
PGLWRLTIIQRLKQTELAAHVDAFDGSEFGGIAFGIASGIAAGIAFAHHGNLGAPSRQHRRDERPDGGQLSDHARDQ